MIRTGPRNTVWNVERRALDSAMEKVAERGELGATAEALVAEHYGLSYPQRERELDRDLVDRDNDTLYEVKSARTVITVDHPRKGEGRYQIIERQLEVHEERQAREGSTSWFVFVLWDSRSSLLDRRRMYPSTLRRILDEQELEASEGHHSGPRYKVPVSDIFEWLDGSDELEW